MRTFILGLLTMAATASLAAAAPATPTEIAIDRGRAFAERQCASCHTVGQDEEARASAPRFKDLRRLHDTAWLRLRFREISDHGLGEMRAIEIDQSMAEALGAYFDSLAPKREPERPR